MFSMQYTSCQRVRCVVRAHGHGPLRRNCATIEMIVHEMHGGSRYLGAMRQHRFVDTRSEHSFATEGGQQRRMHVQQMPVKRLPAEARQRVETPLGVTPSATGKSGRRLNSVAIVSPMSA